MRLREIILFTGWEEVNCRKIDIADIISNIQKTYIFIFSLS